ncbi:uncharacterized protein [Ptychodera flava]|uniref:uncharacterized protein n=1 Tax=Ptychodera flava TaxID=63121 RepID=UPI003969C27D
MSSLPTTKEILGEHLYCAIEALQPQHAERLTGMLLELDNEEIIQMLQYDDLLKKRLQVAMEVLQREESKNKDLLGEKLYSRTEELEPVMCAKITGMLLEMDSYSIQQLLLSQDALQSAVSKAKEALLHEQSRDTSREDFTRNKQTLGEQLYQVIERDYPKHAAKLTGMLLELGQEELVHLLNNKDLMQSRVKIALDVIEQECPGR